MDATTSNLDMSGVASWRAASGSKAAIRRLTLCVSVTVSVTKLKVHAGQWLVPESVAHTMMVRLPSNQGNFCLAMALLECLGV